MRNFSTKGFSLLELIFVIAIFAVVIQVGLPRFQIYQAQNKRKKAIATLNTIYALLKDKRIEDDSYSLGIDAEEGATVYGRINTTTASCDFSGGWAHEIGFSITPCDSSGSPRKSNLPTYQYALNVTANTFTATACDAAGVASVCNGQSTYINRDKITIDQDQNISIVCDAILCGRVCEEEEYTCAGGNSVDEGGGGWGPPTT